MKWVRQNPVTEDSCGQCSLAMLLGVGKREAIARVGHDLGTTTREMSEALRAGGLVVAPRMRKLESFEALPTSQALLLGFWKRYPHWMAYSRGRVYDPVEGVHAVERLPRALRVTHYLWVAPPAARTASGRRPGR